MLTAFPFLLEGLKKAAEEKKEKKESVVQKDLSKLTKKEKLQLLQKQSPELLEMIQDFKLKVWGTTVLWNGPCHLAVITRTSILAPCHVVKILQCIWRSGTSRWNLWVPDLQILSCCDSSWKMGHQDSSLSNGHLSDIPYWLTHCGQAKWPPFSWWRFQMHFLVWNHLNYE